MELIPAIDIIEGKCVRLTKGDYDTKKVYGDPLEMAQQFEDLGLRRLHVVDLDGAKSKHVVNLATLKAITSHTNLIVDFGGGVKTDEDLEKAYEAGAAMVTAGSIAITEPDRYLGWLQKYGADRLILGADVRNGRVSINGWKEDSDVKLEDFLLRYMNEGTKNVLCTEISRDGTLAGPAIELYKSIMKRYPECYLIASGGVGSTEDILALEAAGIPAVVFGKAYYEGRISLHKLKVKNEKFAAALKL
jgi:phosphoribosylformimino-5-aminoimidazole carboxamide ribotide isomerase